MGAMMRVLAWMLAGPVAAVSLSALSLSAISAPASAADDFKLNAQEYFERPGINVMYGQDYYPEGHQGGLSIIMHDERIASNGDVRLEPSPGQWSPIPKPGKREVNTATQEIRVPLAYPEPGAAIARVSIRSSIPTSSSTTPCARGPMANPSSSAWISPTPMPAEWVGQVGFNLELFPGLLFGKSYQLGKSDGVFQQQPSGPGEMPWLARGKTTRSGARDRAVSPHHRVAARRRAAAARRPRQSQQRLVRRARARARGRDDERHRMAA